MLNHALCELLLGQFYISTIIFNANVITSYYTFSLDNNFIITIKTAA